MDSRSEAVAALSNDALAQVRLFRRQFLQLLEIPSLCWPAAEYLRNSNVQEWLYENLFEEGENAFLPPERYRMRVLKPLVARIEQSIIDPEEDEISDNLMSTLSSFLFGSLPSEAEAAQQKSWVTYTAIPPNSPLLPHEPYVKLQENRNIISGAGTTGLRTWEAALHLGSYFLSSPERKAIIKGKNVLELGAGTGFLSILCEKVLGASRVTITDGDEGVVDALKQNLFFEELGPPTEAGVLWWGRALRGSWVDRLAEKEPYDVIIGADVTYDKGVIGALVSTMRECFELWPKVQIIISATIRNEETFAAFEHACDHNAFQVEDLMFPLVPTSEQTCLFHSVSVPIRIMSITAPQKMRDPFAI